METYIYRRQNTVAQFIATRPIPYMSLVGEQKLGSSVAKWWWEQERLDVEGMRTVDREVEHMERGEETDGTETD